MLVSHTPPSSSYHNALQIDMAPSSRQRHPTYRPSASWSPQEDQTLIDARARGLNWQPISDSYFPTKTANACRKRHERLMERRNAEDWDGIRLEALAQAYQDVRREMWTILGNRLGEKWTIVEAKCMEKGVKNLSAAARSASRRLGGNDAEDSANSIDDGTEWAPDLGQTSSGRQYQPEFQSQHHQLPPPHLQRSYAAGPTIASMLSPPNLGYH